MSALFFKSPAPKLLVVVLAQAMCFMLSSANAADLFRESAIPTNSRKMVSSCLPDFLTAFRARNSPADNLSLVIARVAETKSSSTLFLAELAFPHRKSTTPTHELSIFRNVLPVPYFAPAFGAIYSVVEHCFPMSIIVLNTESSSEMDCTANLAICFWSKPIMLFNVFRVVRKQLEILKSVISNIAINVVNDLWGNKKSSNGFLDNKPVFSNVSFCITSWVVGLLNHHISFVSNVSLSSFSHSPSNISEIPLGFNINLALKDQI